MLAQIGYYEFYEKINSDCGKFTHDALEYLFYYYEEIEDYKLDIPEIRCSWSELGIRDFVYTYDESDRTIEDLLAKISDCPINLEYLGLTYGDRYQGVLLPNGNVLFQG